MKVLKGGDYCADLCGTKTPEKSSQEQYEGCYY